ncbi:MAG: hypothetical protein WCV73_02105 [Patescibacteria group bacterium]|jgi:hypothetical protein
MSKPVLNYIIICESVIVSEDGKFSILNIFSEINAKQFPAAHPKFVIVSNTKGEPGNYKQKIEIVNLQDNSVAAKVESSFGIKEGGINVFFGNFVNTIFNNSGKYWIKVTYDDKDVVTNENDNFFFVKQL